MPSLSALHSSVSKIVAGAFFSALFGLGVAPALAQPVVVTLTKQALDADGNAFGELAIAAGEDARFKLTYSVTGGHADRHVVDELPVFPGSNWKFDQDVLFGCSLTPDFDDAPGTQQVLECDVQNAGESTQPVTVTLTSPTPPDACLTLDNEANLYADQFSTEQPLQVPAPTATINVTSPFCVPLFVVGDVEPHAVGDTVNFWGSQWWKNNFMSGQVDKGVASFKGYASDAGINCGELWISRVGNSPPPPATIPDQILVIVTDRVLKVGPAIGGLITQILVVDSDGGYGPAPGHRGNGVVLSSGCPNDN